MDTRHHGFSESGVPGESMLETRSNELRLLWRQSGELATRGMVLLSNALANTVWVDTDKIGRGLPGRIDYQRQTGIKPAGADSHDRQIFANASRTSYGQLLMLWHNTKREPDLRMPRRAGSSFGQPTGDVQPMQGSSTASGARQKNQLL